MFDKSDKETKSISKLFQNYLIHVPSQIVIQLNVIILHIARAVNCLQNATKKKKKIAIFPITSIKKKR